MQRAGHGAIAKAARRPEFWLLLALLAYVLARRYAPAGGWVALLWLATLVLGVISLARWLRRAVRKLIWRVRNRLLVAYVFIAVVPLVLVASLVALGVGILTGQIAVCMINSELEHCVKELKAAARGLAAGPLTSLGDRIRWIGPHLREEHPGLELLVSAGDRQWRYPPSASLTAPSAGWPEAAGLVVKGGELFMWAHARQFPVEVTILAPLDARALERLAPGLAEVSLVNPRAYSAGKPGRQRSDYRSGRPEDAGALRLPPPVNWLDAEIAFAAPLTASFWEFPGRSEKLILLGRTRCSAVLRRVFGPRLEWGEGVTTAYVASLLFLVVAGIFVFVELAALAVGISLTRSITRAVHALYAGTERVMQGDFSHRIEVRGQDQLAQLGSSFNRMTENLERLLEVAKEKERLDSELEIARELQNQLFPRAAPAVRTLRLKAVCRPARLVSGDYYDYVSLPGPRLAIAIGDVVGKGISAALLTATMQSTMRAQLGTAAACPDEAFSTAALVSSLNQHLFAFTPPEKFATFYFGVYEDATGLLRYTNAGHPPPVLIRGDRVFRLEANGTVVGLFASATYEESAIRLEPGDLLVCFTDGVTEPENDYGEMFGEDRLIDLLLNKARSDPEDIVTAVLEATELWTGKSELQDDLTLLVARRI